jgi:hypothetical protein
MSLDEDLAAFSLEVQQGILASADASEDGALLHDEYTRWMVGVLADVGEIDDADVCFYQVRGLEASGYSVDEELGVLNLMVTRYTGSTPPATVTRSEVTTALGRLREFYRRSRAGLHRTMEEASPAFDMVQSIHAFGPDVRSLRLFFLTDGLTTVEELKGEQEGDVVVSFHVWDLRRTFRAATSGVAREPISIDFTARFGEPLPCVTAGSANGDYTAYLAVIPGAVLADVYEQYGPRLLERNVRSFLQARGKVNQGIRKTILEEPEHFLAYNNGISITASRLRFDERGPSRGVGALDDVQIVNGGQTTASIHAARRRDAANLADLSVAAKITVVAPEKLDAFVPKITKFANSQNRVNEADFAANDPYHVELERLSRTVWAPAVDGTQRQTHWFYERARGQYQDALTREGTPARQKAFKATNPTSQKFTKTDLAKFENSWASLPHVVSLGAEKNFRDFALRLGDRGTVAVTQEYFQRLIAKAILFRQTEHLVTGLRFGGYRANIVAYTVAHLSNATAQTIDLDLIWREQRLQPELQDAICAIATAVREVIISPPRGGNVTEWSKRPECWDRVQALSIPEATSLTAAVLRSSGVPDGRRPRAKEALADYTSPGEQALIDEMARVPSSTWFQISKWAKETENLQGWQRSIAFSLGGLVASGRKPSRKQAVQGEKILNEAKRLGFKVASEATQ